MLGRITDLPAQSAPQGPSLDPGRSALAFSLTQQPSKTKGFGSDLFLVNLDGTGLRQVLEHDGDNVFYDSPRFDPTGNLLYFHRRAAVITGGQYKGNDDTIERLDLRTGERTVVIRDAADLDLSPDGRTIVYVHIVNSQGDGLWRADVDGANARPFLHGKDTFYYLQTPRFSPKGDTVAFCAAGHNAAITTGTYAARGPRALAKNAHLGIPSEIFVAPLDGAALRSVGQSGDDVVPAWSPDGTQIAYVGTGAFFVLSLADGTIKTSATGQDFFFGDLLWMRR
ncbi:MAG: TolB family protein [Candidatus Limnocylindria bacterium]